MQKQPQDAIFTRLYLIRHGQTEWNEKKVVQGSLLDIPLNEQGIQQAKAVAQRMNAQFPYDLIYSSPAKRAQETASEISKYANHEILVDRNLIEVDFGSLTNHTLENLESEQNEFIQKFKHFIFTNLESGTTRPEIPQGESINQIEKRIESFINMILTQQEGKKIAVVSHGSFLKCMITSLCGGSLRNYIPYWFDNASITVLDFYGRIPILRMLNNTSHLGQELGFVFPKIC